MLCLVVLALTGKAPAPAGATSTSDAEAAAAATPVPLVERVRAVLEAHCADCRDAHGAGAALDLAALAENPRLVLPGRPDASRIYQRLLARQALPPRGATATKEKDDTPAPQAAARPSPAEVEAVRDWIEALPAREAHCRDRAPITPQEAEAHIDRWVEAIGTVEAADTRFISLVHLWNACVAPARLKLYREATATLLTALARSVTPPEIETLGDASAILAVRPSALSLLAGEWERLTASAPPMLADTVPADWLAAHMLARPKAPSGAVDPAFDVRFDGAAHRAVSTLAAAWAQDVDLVRAAAERAVPPRSLAATLSSVEGESLRPARRLLHGALARATWDRLADVLDGRAGAEPPRLPDAPDDEIDVVLWTDKPRYWPRDLVTVEVSVSKACHLTLINVDGNGRAIVLFPNEMEPDNLIAPSVTVRVPGREAGYQLRFTESGTEDLIAVCRRHARELDGLAYDYERQRFAILGDWRTFLMSAPEDEQKIRARTTTEASRRRRRGRTPPSAVAAEPAALDPDGPIVEGRAAIRVVIDPAGTARN